MCKKLLFLLTFVVVLGLAGANVALGHVIEIPIAAGNDDVEQNRDRDGQMYFTSSDLEILVDPDYPNVLQVVGLRFVEVPIPKGETIVSAAVRFDADDVDDAEHVGNAYVIIDGELSPDAAAFEDIDFNVSDRTRTTAQVQWTSEPWPVAGGTHQKALTADISSVIQEIIDQDGWAAGNALVLILSQDPATPSIGHRECESFNGAGDNVDQRPTLIVEYGPPTDEVWREAEYPDVLGASWRIYTDPSASGLKSMGSDTSDPDDFDFATGPEWVAAYDFDAAGGDYKVLTRVIAPNGDEDSLWVRIVGATSQSHEDPDQPGTGWVRFNEIKHSDTWVWDEVHSNDHGNATVIWTVPAGPATLEISKREGGTKLDGFVITNFLSLDEDAMPDQIDPPPIAGAPLPEDGAIEVDATTLEWTAPGVAVSNRVYLSTDETIDDADLIGETELAIQIAILDPGVTYYWRVDTVEADGTVNTGEVWSFATLALEAHFPVPDDGARSQPMDVQLSWTGGKDSIMHNVYFGTDPAALPPVSMMQMATSYDPGALDAETTYYWRVDEFTPAGTIEGPVWSFTTLGSVPITDPNLLLYYDFETPAGDLVIDQSGHSNHGELIGTPEMVPGLFGTAVSIVLEDVDYIQTTAPLGIVSNTVSVTGWAKHDDVPAAWSGILTHRGTSPGNIGLQHNGNEAGGPELRYMWGADVYWSFSSGLALPIGEWYFAALTISPDQGKLYLNGVEQTATNVAPHEPTNFDSLIRVGRDHRDSRIMTSLIDEVRFYNKTLTDVEILALAKPHIADVTAPGDVVKGVPDEPRDGDVAGWPDNEHPALALDDDVSTKFLHFRGDASPTGFVVEPAMGATVVTGLTLTTANDDYGRDPISFEVSGSNESIDGPYELIAAGDVADFAQEVVWPRFTMNATPIMFENAVAYKYYEVLFTAVRDVSAANSMQIGEVELLGVPAPVAHWPFDDGAGTVALDATGNGNDGTLEGDPQWVADGKVGGALAFDGVDDIVVVTQNIGLPIYNNGIDNAYSITMWVKGGPQNDMRVFSEGSTTDNNPLFNLGTQNTGATGQFDVYIRPAGLEHTYSVAEPFDDTWHHIAWVDENGAARLYIDGVLDGGDFNYTRATLDLDTTTIGGILRAAPSHFFTGLIDDVRVYNQALSPLQVRDLATPPGPSAVVYDFETGAQGWGDLKRGTAVTVVDDGGNVLRATIDEAAHAQTQGGMQSGRDFTVDDVDISRGGFTTMSFWYRADDPDFDGGNFVFHWIMSTETWTGGGWYGNGLWGVVIADGQWHQQTLDLSILGAAAGGWEGTWGDQAAWDFRDDLLYNFELMFEPADSTTTGSYVFIDDVVFN